MLSLWGSLHAALGAARAAQKQPVCPALGWACARAIPAACSCTGARPHPVLHRGPVLGPILSCRCPRLPPSSPVQVARELRARQGGIDVLTGTAHASSVTTSFGRPDWLKIIT
jgi:hypothetical protein